MKGNMLVEVAECPKCGLRIPYRPDCIEHMQAKRIMELESLIRDMHECCMYIGALPSCAYESKRIIGRMEDSMRELGMEVESGKSIESESYRGTLFDACLSADEVDEGLLTLLRELRG